MFSAIKMCKSKLIQYISAAQINNYAIVEKKQSVLSVAKKRESGRNTASYSYRCIDE